MRDGDFRVRGKEVSRVEGLSDAVFGFAITLLVVSLEVPKTFALLYRHALRQRARLQLTPVEVFDTVESISGATAASCAGFFIAVVNALNFFAPQHGDLSSAITIGGFGALIAFAIRRRKSRKSRRLAALARLHPEPES